MTRILEKEKTIKLRLRGRSIKEISNILDVPKSTVGIWCRDIKLNSKQINRLAKRQESGSYKGRMKFLEEVRKKRIAETGRLKNQGLKDIGKINKRDLFIAGASMYWSEGYTYSGGEQVGFTNSDSRMIKFILKWLKIICGISKKDIFLQVKINKIHKKRVKDVEEYWSRIAGIPLCQFNKTVLIRSEVKKIFSNPSAHYGTLRIIVHRGTRLRRRINGWIEGLARAI